MKIAGVTFKNADGVSRQNIIRSLQGAYGIITVDLVPTTYHNSETNADERAIEVREHVSHQLLGYIPKAELDNPMLSDQMTGFIRSYKGTWSVQLDNIKRPTPKQYAYVKSMCAKSGKAMPAYDVRAYAYIFETLREK